jgi:hypothetical protein
MDVKTIQRFIWFGVLCVFPGFLFGQIANSWCASKVKTLRTYVEGNETAYPVIELGTENQIRIEFDCFDDHYWDIDYQVVHCNSKDQPSELMTDEYMSGFETNRVSDYASSINTTFQYINYRLLLPNDDVKLLVSGNYEVRFFKTGYPDSLIAITHFMVYESIVSVKAEVVRPLGAGVENTSQEIKLTLNYNDFSIQDVFSELQVSILQNNCPLRALSDLKPVFVRDNELVYAYNGENMLPGGNEFRVIDTRSLKYKASSTNVTEYLAPYYHITPRPEESRSFKRYFSDQDINGQYFIYADYAYDYYKAADYAFVHPVLLMAEPLLDGNIYVFGGFNDWQLNDEYKMQYNFNTHQYEGNFLLKQGYYNYIFVSKNNYTGEVDLQRFEGSHDETENNYSIYVFYKGMTDRFQRLVGYRVANSKFQ